MLKLYKDKLEIVDELYRCTKKLTAFSPKSDDEKIIDLMHDRQKCIEAIKSIDLDIDKCSSSGEKYQKEAYEINEIKKQIRELAKDIVIMDKEIRRNINDELKNLKNKLSHPEVSYKLINIKI